MASAKNKVMTRREVKKILCALDDLKCGVSATLHGFGAENTRAYEEAFDALYNKIERAVGLKETKYIYED
jgi:uncharacterized protein (DUF1810 family)